MDSSSEQNQKEQKEKERNNQQNQQQQTIHQMDPIFCEIQELLAEQDMIQKKLIEQNENNYILELTFPGGITLKKFDIKFLLIIPKKYPKKEPELYCITIFSHPHLCDGRNLLNNVINSEWNNKKYPLDFIINKIPKFIIKCEDYINNTNITIGKYNLNNTYIIEFLKNLPIYFHLIPETKEILTISDISLCLYDLIGNNFKLCKLSFFLNIKDIINIEIKPNNNLILIKYLLDDKKKENIIDINSQICEAINSILKEKMKLYEKKSGQLPDIDINKLEKEIKEKEKDINNNNINMEQCQLLMNLYQQAIEYYSAINNPKFRDINIKIHQLLENTKLLENNNKDNNKENKDNIIQKDKIVNNQEENKDKNKPTEENEKNDIKNNDKNMENKENKGKKIEGKFEKEIKKEETKEIIKKEEKKEKEETNKSKEINKDNKIEKNNENDSLRLKIDEGEIKTLDVGDDDEDEEEEDK